MKSLSKSKNFRCAFHVLFSTFFILSDVISVKSSESAEHKVVETNDGRVRGVRKTTLFKKVDFYSFRGIPYAKSPTGELRFKVSLPIEPWTPRVLDAFEHGPICIQLFIPLFGNSQAQSEDCLFLNIYVPADVLPDEKLPVMIFIHGGAFAFGSGNDDVYGPDFLIEQRVIVVTLNYRLGILGFLSLGSPEYSGNMGLKDQQLALKWIHTNIKHFGGDNQRITIFGQSAGGASTHFHMLSSESRKYFRNAIPMSGTVNNLWAMYEKGDHLTLAYKISASLGEPKHTFEELITFLKTSPPNKLIEYEDDEAVVDRTGHLIMAPLIEKRNAVSPFIVDLPSKIYNESTINMDAMFTYCSAEFIPFYYYKENVINNNLKGFDRNFSLTFPFRERHLAFDSPEYKPIMRKIRTFYFGDAAIDKSTQKQYIDLWTDVNFVYGIDKSARQHAAKSNLKTFYSRFSVDLKLNMEKRNFAAANETSGASHADEICYLFRCEKAQSIYDDIFKNKDDEQSKVIIRVIENMTKMFANFAKYGDPTHDGDPVDGFLPIQDDRVHFVDVTNDGLKPGINPNQAANEMWTQIEQQVHQISSG